MAKRSKTTAITNARTGGDSEEACPSDFASAITRIAVSQICQTVGFRRIQTSALQILSDVAARYLRAITEAAASSAVSSGRTQSNLYDVVRALEELNSLQGFRGASVLDRNLLASSTVTDLASFVRYNAEIPFAKPIRRRAQPGNAVAPPPPSVNPAVPNRFLHIPRWLPAIPETITHSSKVIDEEKSRSCDLGGGSGTGSTISDDFGGKVEMEMRMELPVKRDRVRFKIGGVGGLGMRRGVVCKGGKRVSCQNGGIVVDDDEEEENGDEVCLKKMMLMIKKKKKKINSNSISNSRRTKLIGR